MKALLKVAIPLAAVFASTFLVAKLFGFLTVEQVTDWLTYLQTASPIFVGCLVAFLLFMDLFVAIPNLTLTLLAGYLLGFLQGSAYALLGAVLSGLVGYLISRRYGSHLFRVLLRDENEKNQIIETFRKHGFLMILCSRAVPILPEVSACLAGATKMHFGRFMSAWLISTVPYTLIATYSGSISTLKDPKPALIAAVAITATLWLAWYLFNRMVVVKLKNGR